MRHLKQKRRKHKVYVLHIAVIPTGTALRNAVDGADKWQKVKTETKFVQTKNARQIGKISRRNQERQSEVSISFRC